MENEIKEDLITCECGNQNFIIYISTIIDDARFYCSNCKTMY